MFYELFDPAPLTRSHLILSGASFLLVYVILSLLLKKPSRFLRPVPAQSAVYFAGFILVAVTALMAYPNLESTSLRFGLLAASFLILLIGLYDEQYSLSPRSQLFWQIIIAAVAVLWGWGISYISHPFSTGIIRLDQWTLGPLVWPGSLLTIVWLLLLMNAINW